MAERLSKMACRATLVTALLLATIVCGCGGSSGTGNNNNDTTGGTTGTRSLTGTVTNSSGTPLAGITVSVGSITTTTGADGKWTLTGLPSTGTLNVTISGSGYSTVTVPVTDASQPVNASMQVSTTGGDTTQPPSPPNFDNL